MRKIVSAFILAAGAMALVGCSEGTQNASGDSSSFSSSSSSDASAESSSVNEESSIESTVESTVESSGADSSVSDESSESASPEENASGIHLSVCPVPAWGISESDEGDLFEAASEYDTYRVIQGVRFEDGAVKNIFVYAYVVSESFDMTAFAEKWGVEPIWNGEYYEGEMSVPEEYAEMSIEEVKLSVAKPLLRKYGSSTYDGFPEIVMVDPSVAPDPDFEF